MSGEQRARFQRNLMRKLMVYYAITVLVVLALICLAVVAGVVFLMFHIIGKYW